MEELLQSAETDLLLEQAMAEKRYLEAKAEFLDQEFKLMKEALDEKRNIMEQQKRVLDEKCNIMVQQNKKFMLKALEEAQQDREQLLKTLGQAQEDRELSLKALDEQRRVIEQQYREQLLKALSQAQEDRDQLLEALDERRKAIEQEYRAQLFKVRNEAVKTDSELSSHTPPLDVVPSANACTALISIPSDFSSQHPDFEKLVDELSCNVGACDDEPPACASSLVVSGQIGYVYAAWNPLFPDLIKIGATMRSSPYIRVRELSSCAGVPEPFQLVASIPTSDPFALERTIHAFYASSRRYGRKKEFFMLSREDVVYHFHVRSLEAMGGSSGVSSSMNEAKKRKLNQTGSIPKKENTENTIVKDRMKIVRLRCEYLQGVPILGIGTGASRVYLAHAQNLVSLLKGNLTRTGACRTFNMFLQSTEGRVIREQDGGELTSASLPLDKMMYSYHIQTCGRGSASRFVTLDGAKEILQKLPGVSYEMNAKLSPFLEAHAMSFKEATLEQRVEEEAQEVVEGLFTGGFGGGFN